MVTAWDQGLGIAIRLWIPPALVLHEVLGVVGPLALARRDTRSLETICPQKESGA